MIRGSWNKGKKRTDEQKQKMRENKLKLYSDPNEIEKLRVAQLKRFQDSNERKKISNSLRGNKNMVGVVRSEESKLKQSLAMKGKPKSEETKAKMRKPKTEEHKRKIGEAHRGRKKSQEQIKKMSVASTGKHHTEQTKQLLSTIFSGPNNPAWVGGRKQYCEKWTAEFRRRIRMFFGDRCVECGKPQTDKLLHCHHVYYDKKACCEVSPDGKYYSDLGIKGAPKTFEIVGDPNKFVPLCQKCHALTTPKKDREVWARKYEKIINENYGGRSYFDKEEIIILPS